MGMDDYEAAKEIIERTGGDFEGAKPEELVAKAEVTLGIAFPATYRRFLLELGCGGIRGLEIYGLIDGDFKNSTIPDGIWLTLEERRSIDLNPAFVIVSAGGDGTYHVLDTTTLDSGDECPVLRISVDGQADEPVASNFGSYLLEAVRAVL